MSPQVPPPTPLKLTFQGTNVLALLEMVFLEEVDVLVVLVVLDDLEDLELEEVVEEDEAVLDLDEVGVVEVLESEVHEKRFENQISASTTGNICH